jgi:hypothetical protein
VRIDALSPVMENSEWEVFAEGKNLLRGHPERLSSGNGWGWYGADEKLSIRGNLVDGNTNSAQRCTTRPPDPDTSFANMEADLGAAVPIDNVVFHVSRWDNPMIRVWCNDPEGWRVVSVLDENRKVVFSRLVTLFTPEFKAAKGVMVVRPAKGEGPYVGRAVAAGSRGWFSLGEFLTGYLEVKSVATPADAGRAARVAEFARRNTPEERAAFAKRFFEDVDLARPELAAARQRLADGKPSEALDVFKRVFLKRLEYFDALVPSGPLYLFPADAQSGAIRAADDLLACRKVDRKARTVCVDRSGEVLDFSASVIPWGEPHPRCLLLAYVATGERKYLDRWAELLDERSLFFQRWADNGDRRDYFPLSQLGGFAGTLRDLREAQKLRPAFAADLPSATLARYLSLWTEEALPAYWRLARKTVFNHQFNIWGSAYTLSRVLPDFYVGQRLEQEMVQHFERLWTLALTRDGSMIEVADFGHVPCPLGTPAYRYFQMKRGKPAWFTPELEAWFLHGYRMAARYPVRFIAPNGVEHRSGQDFDTACFEQAYQMLLRRPGEKYPKPFLSDYTESPGTDELAGVIVREPEVRAIIDTVYGRGRSYDALSKRLQGCYNIVTNRISGSYQGVPKTVSDYMPYAGIHYLRRDWSPDASFIEMVCQPPGGSANDRYMDTLSDAWYGNDFWDTQFHYWDFGEPLLLSRPLLVDGQNQCQSFETRGWKPGSKTERLVEAPEKPLPNRFHCSARYDYQECFFTGAYQNWELTYDKSAPPRKQLAITDPAVTNVHTTRQLFQLREPRLIVAVDRVRFSDGAPHRMSAKALLLPVDNDARCEADAAKGEFRLVRPAGAQLTVRQFGVTGLAYETLKPVKGRACLQAQWQAKGETVLVSLLESRRDPTAPATLTEVRCVTTERETGFDATTREGSKIVFRVPLKRGGAAGGLAPEQATLAVTGADGVASGLALGTDTVGLGGRNVKLAADDCEFEIARTGAKPVLTPVWRPIDPPQVLPESDVFTDSLEVSVVSKTPGVELRYTVDGSEPTAQSALYTSPFKIDKKCMVQARAFRPGQTTVPFATDGTRVSDSSFARFRKELSRPAVKADATRPGLAYDYLEGRWFRLFGYADRQAAKSSGTVERLLDVAMRKTDGPFAVRYSGYLDVPAAGVYTFHAPKEYVVNGCEPGYDLRVFVDGEEWNLGQLWHGRGAWSVPLDKGTHRFQVVFADARAKDVERQRIDYWWGYPTPWVVWRGAAPVLELSGPGLARQPVPAAWLRCVSR